MIEAAHHDGSPLYVSDSAPAFGDRIEVRLRTRRSQQPESVVLRTVLDGEPLTILAEPKEGDDDEIWWSASLDIHNRLTHYRWLLVGGSYGYTWLNASGQVDFDVPDADDFVITAAPPPPGWAATSVVYQVFPDRFARQSCDDQGQPLSAKYGQPLPGWAVPRDWSAHPLGRGPQTPYEFFGGDLDGLREHLDYIQELGVEVVYLTPIFPAGSTHRYDSTTFEVIDPLLGGDRALAELAEAVHQRGMRLLGDITLNHCGDQHEWFIRAMGHSEPERGYFRFDDSLEHGYACWFGVKTLPKFDLTSTHLRAALINADRSVVRRWIGGPQGLDGWRVDVANMAGRMGSIDVTHEVAREVRQVMAQVDDDLLLLAEHGHDASADLDGDGWHGTMNYAAFTRPVWSWLRAPEFNETFLGLPVPIPVITGEQMVSSIRAFHGRIPWRSLVSSWNLLGSHDTARIRTVVGTAERQVAAFAMAIGLPGIPMVFSGDEIGETGLWGEDARTPFPWQDQARWDRHTQDAYRRLIDLRRSSPALAVGGLRWVHVSADVVVFLREHPQDRLLIAVARNPSDTVHLSLGQMAAGDAEPLFGFVGAPADGHLTIEFPHAGAGIWRLT